MADFLFGALFDRDIPNAIRNRPIDGGRRQSGIEGNSVVVGSERFEIGADFVADIPGTGSSIRSDDAKIDFAMLHQMTAGIVGNHRVGDAVSGKLPCRQ